MNTGALYLTRWLCAHCFLLASSCLAQPIYQGINAGRDNNQYGGCSSSGSGVCNYYQIAAPSAPVCLLECWSPNTALTQSQQQALNYVSKSMTWDYLMGSTCASNTAAHYLSEINGACSHALGAQQFNASASIMLDYASSCAAFQRNPSSDQSIQAIYQATLPEKCACATCARFQTQEDLREYTSCRDYSDYVSADQHKFLDGKWVSAWQNTSRVINCAACPTGPTRYPLSAVGSAQSSISSINPYFGCDGSDTTQRPCLSYPLGAKPYPRCN